jgi:hypothetical protein
MELNNQYPYHHTASTQTYFQPNRNMSSPYISTEEFYDEPDTFKQEPRDDTDTDTDANIKRRRATEAKRRAKLGESPFTQEVRRRSRLRLPPFDTPADCDAEYKRGNSASSFSKRGDNLAAFEAWYKRGGDASTFDAEYKPGHGAHISVGRSGGVAIVLITVVVAVVFVNWMNLRQMDLRVEKP